jgi:CRP/FNR family cyclic AMP-dependent transcriptional regulator
MDQDVLAALRQSTLRGLSADRLEQIVEGSRWLDLPRGGHHHRVGDPAAAGIVVSGLLRVYISAPDGPQLTVRYARFGALLAIATTFSTFSNPAHTEALIPTRILLFDTDRLVALARRDVVVANALLVEASNRSVSFMSEVAGTYFPTMRQRVVRHLLDIAAGGDEPDLIARVSQQDLAAAVGSLREVVVRILRDLREDGLIDTRRNEIHILEPARLHAETFPQRP